MITINDFLESIPVSISVEEQNVKNSIMRLNERLNSNLQLFENNLK
jgi:hypothetical protein